LGCGCRCLGGFEEPNLCWAAKIAVFLANGCYPRGCSSKVKKEQIDVWKAAMVSAEGIWLGVGAHHVARMDLRGRVGRCDRLAIYSARRPPPGSRGDGLAGTVGRGTGL